MPPCSLVFLALDSAATKSQEQKRRPGSTVVVAEPTTSQENATTALSRFAAEFGSSIVALLSYF
jgi:hypothetical protein